MNSCAPLWVPIVVAALALMGIWVTHHLTRNRERDKAQIDACKSWRERMEKQRQAILLLAVKHYSDPREKDNTTLSANTVMSALRQLTTISQEVSFAEPKDSKRFRDALTAFNFAITGPEAFQDSGRDFSNAASAALISKIHDEDNVVARACLRQVAIERR